MSTHQNGKCSHVIIPACCWFLNKVFVQTRSCSSCCAWRLTVLPLPQASTCRTETKPLKPALLESNCLPVTCAEISPPVHLAMEYKIWGIPKTFKPSSRHAFIRKSELLSVLFTTALLPLFFRGQSSLSSESWLFLLSFQLAKPSIHSSLPSPNNWHPFHDFTSSIPVIFCQRKLRFWVSAHLQVWSCPASLDLQFVFKMKLVD